MNKEDLKKVHEITGKLDEQEEKASELKRTAQDRDGDKEHTFERDGDEITITEKTMWQEVYSTGSTNIDSAEILKEEHPEVFEAYEKQAEIAQELQDHCQEAFGVDYRRMRLSDYIKIVEDIVDLKLEE